MASKLEEGMKPGEKYLFADLLEMAGGRDKRFAVKSKLNKMRAKKDVTFKNGYYVRKA